VTRRRAVRWTGGNADAVEQVTGRCVALSVLDERVVLVDAWGDCPQLCSVGCWVVVNLGITRVMTPSQFSQFIRRVV
jgi:hypothetical protein